MEDALFTIMENGFDKMHFVNTIITGNVSLFKDFLSDIGFDIL